MPKEKRETTNTSNTRRVYVDTSKWSGMHQGVKKGKKLSDRVGKPNKKAARHLARRIETWEKDCAGSNSKNRPGAGCPLHKPGSMNVRNR